MCTTVDKVKSLLMDSQLCWAQQACLPTEALMFELSLAAPFGMRRM